MVDLKGHPFIQKQFNKMSDEMKNGDITGAAICQRSIASQICKCYSIKYLPKFKSFRLNDKNFPKPMEMAKMIDAMGIIESKYSELLCDMVAQGNKAAHPEGKELPSERNVKNNCTDLEEFLNIFLREFPSEAAHKAEGLKSNKTVTSTAKVKTSSESRTSATVGPKPSPTIKPKQTATDHEPWKKTIVVKRKSEKRPGEYGYIIDQYFFEANSFPELYHDIIEFSFGGKTFTMRKGFYSLCIKILLDIYDKRKEDEVFSISIDTNTIKIKDYNSIKTYFGGNLTQEDAIAFYFVLILRALYPRVSFGKEVRLNDPCPCGSGKKYKNCCIFQPRMMEPI